MLQRERLHSLIEELRTSQDVKGIQQGLKLLLVVIQNRLSNGKSHQVGHYSLDIERHWKHLVIVKDDYSHQHKHKITNLWNFDLIGLWICTKIIKEKTPLLHKFVCFPRCLIKGFRLKVLYDFNEKLLLSPNLCYIRGTHFSQYVILTTALTAH